VSGEQPATPTGAETAAGTTELPPLSRARKAGYALGDTGLNVYWQGISLFLFFFYTEIMGLSAATAGFTVFVASLWDGITDPWMGGIADRTRTRIGRFRPYLLFGPPLLGLSFVLAFWAPAALPPGLLPAYALLTHLLLRTLYTVVAVPYSALSARMTGHSHERASLAGWRMQGAALGGLSTAVATPWAVAKLVALTGDPRLGWLCAAALMALLASLLFGLCFASVREPPETENNPVSGINPLLQGLRDIAAGAAMLRRNGPLVRVLLAIVMASLCLSMLSKTLLYWFKYAVGNEAAAGVALAITPLLLLLIAPLWAQLAQRWSKRAAWLLGCAIALPGYLAFFVLPMRAATEVYLGVGAIALGTTAFAVMFWAMLPDTVEYDHWLCGERHEAKVFGFATFAQKAALGLNALLLGVLLDLVGFAPGAAQSAATLDGMKAIMSLVPALGVLLTVCALYRYPIDAQFHRQLRQQLAARGQPA
jgi:GPH family glycoside/pentoside/hexuronide:cation symporter